MLIFLLSLMSLHSKIEELNLNSDYGYYKKINNQKVFIAQGNAHINIDNNEVFCEEIEIYLSDEERSPVPRRNRDHGRGCRLFDGAAGDAEGERSCASVQGDQAGDEQGRRQIYGGV